MGQLKKYYTIEAPSYNSIKHTEKKLQSKLNVNQKVEKSAVFTRAEFRSKTIVASIASFLCEVSQVKFTWSNNKNTHTPFF